MQHPRLFIIMVVLGSLLCAALWFVGIPECIIKHEEHNGSVNVTYMKLLVLFNETNPGYGLDVLYTNRSLHHPKAYALYASAEAHRFQETRNKSAIENAIRAARWLVENSDLDKDGEIGWGLPFPWDAGGDGTINPENTEYAIETAMGVQALLDVYDAAVLTEYKSEVSEFPVIAAKAMETFLRGRFDEVDTGAIFWYSTAPEDSYHVINTCSMLTGQLQRLSCYPVANRSLFAEWADRSVLYILAHKQEDSNGNPYWMYYGDEIPGPPTLNRPNDIQHEVYTLQGLFYYKVYGGRYGYLIDARSLLATIDRFVRKTKVYELPLGYVYTSNWQSYANSWARVWGLGYALHFAVQLESYLNETPSLSTKLYTILCKKYQKDGQLLLRPDDKKLPFYSRQIAFVLKGLSFYEYINIDNKK